MWPQRNKNIGYAVTAGRQGCFQPCSASAAALLLLHQLGMHIFPPDSQLQTRAPLASPLGPQTPLKIKPFCTHSSCKSVRVYHQPPRSCAKKHQPLELSKDTGLSLPRPLKTASPGEGQSISPKIRNTKPPNRCLLASEHHWWPHLAHKSFRRMRTLRAWLNEKD